MFNTPKPEGLDRQKQVHFSADVRANTLSVEVLVRHKHFSCQGPLFLREEDL